MKKGFTLVEMLVVIGIIIVLVGASVAAYGPVTRRAQKARGQELVTNTKDALEFLLQKRNEWPLVIRKNASGMDAEITSEVGASLARYGAMNLNYRKVESDGVEKYELVGLDQFGILTPWAAAVVKQRLAGGTVNDSTPVPSGGTIKDHRLRYAIDDDYDGRVKVGVSASGKQRATTVRASACVWCCGYDGKFGTSDDIYSWGRGQEE